MKRNTPDMDKVLRFISNRGYFQSLERGVYDKYDITEALKVIEAIGKMRHRKFVIDEENRFAYENFIRWCHGDSTMQAIDPFSGSVINGDLNRGIYIAGNTGSGKSWCLEIMLAYVQAMGFRIRFSSEDHPRALYWVIARADEICREFSASGDIDRFKSMSIIGVQDFGQEPEETLYMGNRLNVMQQMIEYRGDMDDRLTLITSNLRISSDLLKKTYGDRVQSRLVEMCNYLEIKGRDRRKGI